MEKESEHSNYAQPCNSRKNGGLCIQAYHVSIRNNNELQPLARANYPPYGTDYPTGPTRRFTNGRTYVDFIAEFLGLPNHIPAYAASRGTERVLQGVNYASGGAGIRTEIGKIVGERVDLFTRLEHHRSIVAHIKRLKGDDELVAQVWENAFILLESEALHALGAKKVALYGLGPIGCAPSQVK
nr:PREDICTED: GDSL esterase/lipase At1g29660-like [Daucus carota subsp. sativus]